MTSRDLYDKKLHELAANIDASYAEGEEITDVHNFQDEFSKLYQQATSLDYKPYIMYEIQAILSNDINLTRLLLSIAVNKKGSTVLFTKKANILVDLYKVSLDDEPNDVLLKFVKNCTGAMYEVYYNEWSDTIESISVVKPYLEFGIDSLNIAGEIWFALINVLVAFGKKSLKGSMALAYFIQVISDEHDIDCNDLLKICCDYTKMIPYGAFERVYCLVDISYKIRANKGDDIFDAFAVLDNKIFEANQLGAALERFESGDL